MGGLHRPPMLFVLFQIRTIVVRQISAASRVWNLVLLELISNVECVKADHEYRSR